MAFYNGSSVPYLRRRGHLGWNCKQKGPFSVSSNSWYENKFSYNNNISETDPKAFMGNGYNNNSKVEYFTKMMASGFGNSCEGAGVMNSVGIDAEIAGQLSKSLSEMQTKPKGFYCRQVGGGGRLGPGAAAVDLHGFTGTGTGFENLFGNLRQGNGEYNDICSTQSGEFSNHTDNFMGEAVGNDAMSYSKGGLGVDGAMSQSYNLCEITERSGMMTIEEGSPVKGGPKRGCDQFGLAGLMSSLKAIETDPGLVVLPIGYEVSPLLGFNLLTTPQDEKISSSFSGPFGSGRLPAHLIEADVPAEYKISETSAQDEEFIKPIREKLLPPKLHGYNEDLLFYLFYNLTNDVLQPMAAAILYDRDWRFHTERRIWISKIPGKLPFEKGPEFERGLYYIFDPATWKKTVQELFIEMDKLEGRPHVL